MATTIPLVLVCCAALAFAFGAISRAAGQNPGPFFEMESALDTFFSPATGTLRLGDFTVASNVITPLARTQLGFDPRLNFIPPRAAKKGSNVFEVIETVWLEQG